MIAQSIESGAFPKDEEAENYRKQTAIRVVEPYLKRKEGLVGVRGMIAFLRKKKGLTDGEVQRILGYLNAEHLKQLL